MSTSSSAATRSLHLVDIENLAGHPCAPPAVVLDTFDRYLELAEWQPHDHVIVAANPHLLATVVFDLPVPCSAHSACGRDGADRELLSLAAPEFVARRYGRLVVGSGDHLFAPRAHAVRELGAEVLVVARADGCSSRTGSSTGSCRMRSQTCSPPDASRAVKKPTSVPVFGTTSTQRSAAS